MRQDWTLLCTEVHPHDAGAIGLENVFSTLQVTSPYGSIENTELVLFDPPALLVSRWTAEFEAERRVQTATVQLMAPGGEDALWAESVEFDFRNQASFLMVYILQNIEFVGIGTYEFHVLLEENRVIGEWGRASLAVSEE